MGSRCSHRKIGETELIPRAGTGGTAFVDDVTFTVWLLAGLR